MKKLMKKVLALTLAMILCLSQLAMPALAETTADPAAQPSDPAPQAGEVSVPVAPGGSNEQVPVDIIVTANSDGSVTATAETPAGGSVTDSGITANVESTVTENAQGDVIAEDTAYTAESADGTYTAEGGTVTTQEAKTGEEVAQQLGDQLTDEQKAELTEDLTADLITDGNVNADVTVENNVDGITVTTGDLQSEDPANYDQTTVTVESNRTLEVNTSVTTQTTAPIFVDADGNVVELDETQAYNYYYEDIYNVDNVSAGSAWSVGGSSWYRVKEDGTEEKIGGEGVCQRVVYDNNGTPDDPSDDSIVNGLYCLDASTGIRDDFAYRMVNLEDATEEGYFTEDEAAHLRAIMTYGYTWDDDGADGEQNLEDIKTMISDAKAAAEESGDTATLELLSKIDLENLTRKQAATATGMAVWHYGNRFELAEGETVKIKNGNASVDALYEYLISLREETPTETQLITEEKFIDNLSFTVGDMVADDAANQDSDNTNDVYDVSVKFSLVVAPDPKSDDLLVSVVDEAGAVVETVRIAGENEADESYNYAETEIGEDGKTYYVIGGLQLTENQNTSFNIKLEGQQMLQEGVYVFESEKRSVEDAFEICYAHWTSDENWESEKAWVESLGNGKYGLTAEEKANVTKETYREYCKKIYFSKYLNEDGTFKTAVISSQNFIGKSSGVADVSVNMAVDINFNVDEAVVTETRVWRSETYTDPAVTTLEETSGGTPRMGRRMLQTIPEEEVPLNEEVQADEAALEVEEELDEDDATTIPDEEVPLAAAPATGDLSILWVVMGMMGMGGTTVLNRKIKKTEEEEA